MGPSADQEELASCGNWSRGWSLRLRQSAGVFEYLCRKAFKSPFLFVRELKKKYGGLIFKNVKYKAHFTLKFQNKNERA